MNSHYRILMWLMVLSASLLTGPVCSAIQTTSSEEKSPIGSRIQTKFIQLQTDEYQNPVALQTATARYILVDESNDEQLEIILESVVHVGDPSYYRSFQKRFEQYDSVLYESIFKRDEQKQSGGPDQPSGFQILQQLSTGTIGLAYQFDEVEYEGDNMVHSDLSPKEISERMRDRGENSTTMFTDLLTHVIQKINASKNSEGSSESGDELPVNNPDGIALDLSVFTDPDGIMKIRQMMASALVNSGLLESPFPPGIHRMIIGDRNDNVMSVLDAEIKKGKRRIAIFYGVGHMPDFERRLLSEYGMKKVSVNWRNAWDLRDGAIEGAPLEGLVESAFRDSIKDKLRQFAKGVGQKKTADSETEQPESAKDDELEAMERALKELEAKIIELEKRAEEDKKGKKEDKEEDK